MIIYSGYAVLSPAIPDFDEMTVKNEPMLFNCDLEHAKRLGGPITNEVLKFLPVEWKSVPLVVDSRVHMLMPGWYPCIPGWHHDDVPRTRADGQPNYGPDQLRSIHIMCLINGDICPTTFATGEMDFEIPPPGRTIYGDLHPVIEDAIKAGKLHVTHAPSNRLVCFDDRTWHTGTKAVKTGWRFFIRISRYFNPDRSHIQRGGVRTNEIRRQVQVYMDNPNQGW
jgi:hypothetical protein